MQQYVTVQGEQVPAIGFGTWQIQGKACFEAVLDALSVGYRHVDTAAMYGNEREVGRALRESATAREEIFLTTKIWPDDFAPADAPRAAEACLSRLDVNYVDLLLLHWPSSRIPVRETLSALRPLKEQGRIRHLGLSNYAPEQVKEAAAEVSIFCNQIPFDPYHDPSALLDQARAMDYLLTAYSPLGRGRVVSDPTLEEVGRHHEKSPAQVALRWLIQHDKVAAIPKAADADRRRSNFDLFDFELSAEEMRQIATLAKSR